MLFLGTTNPGKVREFVSILAPLGVDVQPVALDVPETGHTIKENARQKAFAYAMHTGGVTVSEDSGLAIPILNGLPGPWSARFSDCILDGSLETLNILRVEESGRSREEIDIVNCQRVFSLLHDTRQPYRAAQFVVHLVVAKGAKILFEAGGEVHGWIAEEARGNNGFGYDPIFIGQDTYGKTYAELDPVRKNLRSHRKRVLAEFSLWVAQAIVDGVLS
jgi:XTP/dITP diphosphohydrolase